MWWWGWWAGGRFASKKTEDKEFSTPELYFAHLHLKLITRVSLAFPE